MESFWIRLRFASVVVSIVWKVSIIVGIVESIVSIVSSFSRIRGRCGLWSLTRNESTVVLFSICSSSEGLSFSFLCISSFNSFRIVLGSWTCTWRGRSVVSIGSIICSWIVVWVSLLILTSIGGIWEVSICDSSSSNVDEDSIGFSILGTVVVVSKKEKYINEKINN